MLSDAIEYPLAGDDAVTTLVVGGIISLLSSVLVVPAVLIGGYSVAVCRAVLAGEADPPTFDDWGQIAADGFSVLAITVLYWLPGLALAGVGVGTGVLVLAGAGGDPAAGSAMILLGAVGSLAGLVYAVAVAYVLPAAIVNYARTDRLRAAWDVGTLRAIVSDAAYAKAWLLAAAVLFGFNAAGSSLAVFLVGFLVLFFGQVVGMYVFTRGTMAALDIAPDADQAGTDTIDPTQDEDQSAAPDDTTGSVVADEYVRSAGGDGSTDDRSVARTEPAAGEVAAADADHQPAEGDAGPTKRDLEAVAAVGPTTAGALRDAGFETVTDLRAATRAELATVEAVGPATANRIKSDVDDE